MLSLKNLIISSIIVLITVYISSASENFSEIELMINPLYLEINPGHLKADLVKRAENLTALNFNNISKTDFAGPYQIGFKIGIRFWNIIGGITAEKSSEIKGQLINYDPAIGTNVANYDYSLVMTMREYPFYLGYIQQLPSDYNLVILFGVGPASLEGSQSYFDYTINQIESLHTFKENYVCSRFETHLRYDYRWNISFDLIAGYRISNAGRVRGQRDVSGITDSRDFNVPVLDLNNNPMEFDLSGWFFGLGITLKHRKEKHTNK